MIQGTYYKEWSTVLGREMEFKVYGHAGVPVLALPARGGRFYDWENNGMPDAIAQLLNEGKVQLFCADAMDGEGLLNGDLPQRRRAEQRRKDDPPDRGFRPAQPQRQRHHHAVQQSIQQENPSRFHGDIIAARPFFSCRLHTRKTMNLRAHSTHLSIFDINQLRLIRFSLSKTPYQKNARSPP